MGGRAPREQVRTHPGAAARHQEGADVALLSAAASVQKLETTQRSVS